MNKVFKYFLTLLVLLGPIEMAQEEAFKPFKAGIRFNDFYTFDDLGMYYSGRKNTHEQIRKDLSNKQEQSPNSK